MLVSLYFDTQSLGPYELLTNHYRHSSVCCHRCSSIPTATLTHNIPTSELQGDYPSRAVYDLMLSLNQVTIHLLRMLRFFISYNVANTTMQKKRLHVNTPTQINRINSIITILLFITKNSSNNIYCIYRLKSCHSFRIPPYSDFGTLAPTPSCQIPSKYLHLPALQFSEVL